MVRDSFCAPLQRKAEYFPELDGLRAVAVLAVLASHFGNDVALLVNYGPLGVQLFFVLSGFLITGILLEARARAEVAMVSVRAVTFRFYARRALRLLPLLYLVLGAAIVLGVGEIRDTWPWHAFYASNLRFAWTGSWEGPYSHFWSLAVEEQFYLIWPWVILTVPLASLDRLLASLFASALIFRLGALAIGLTDVTRWTLPFASIDVLVAGAALAAHASRQANGAQARSAPAWLRRGLGPAAITVVLQIALSNEGGGVLEALAGCGWALLMAAIVWSAAMGRTGMAGRFLRSRPMAFIGRISYGIYVIHLFVPVMMTRVAGGSIPFASRTLPSRLVCATAISVALATLSWFVLERPVNRLRRRIPYVPQPGRGDDEGEGGHDQSPGQQDAARGQRPPTCTAPMSQRRPAPRRTPRWTPL